MMQQSKKFLLKLFEEDYLKINTNAMLFPNGLLSEKMIRSRRMSFYRQKLHWNVQDN